MTLIFTVFVRLGSLPEEVQQKLKRLSDLNKEILEVLRANNRMQNHLLKNIDRMSRSKKVRYLNIIQQQFDTINRYADEKVKISNDAYGFVRLFKLCTLI